jgi:protein TonB
MKPIITTLLLLFTLTAFTQTSIDTSEIFTVVEDMPAFPGCEDLPTNVERKKCTETNLLKFYYKNLRLAHVTPEDSCYHYSRVAISFIIDTTGYITEVKKLNGCDGIVQEVIRVTELMNKDLFTRWQAGEQRGKKVRVRYNLPMRLRFRQY